MDGRKKRGCSTKEEPGGSSIAAEENWHSAYKNSLKDIESLARYLPLETEEKACLKQVMQKYRMRIPLYYLSLIKEPFNPHDPVRRQCVPSAEEIREGIQESIDPLGEEKTSPFSCLVHRYPDRVLLLVTGQCFMYCRHCTRKRLWRSTASEPSLKDIEQALTYVKKNRYLREVIISGGDPLTLPTERLDYVLSLIAGLRNVEVIRIGTRAPVVLPQRIDQSLCAVLEKYDKLWINVQFNHPREITPRSTAASRRLQACGIPVSNQSVLLKDINDDPRVMKKLCQQLQKIRIRPYYLFQCDPVVGAYHFRTSIWKGVEILKKMRGYTSGMCIPTFVIDGIDGKGKVPLEPDYLASVSGEGVILKNFRDELFFYHDPGDAGVPSRKGEKKSSPAVVGIAFNLKKAGSGTGDDRDEEYDELETIECLKREIESFGLQTALFEQNGTFLKDILQRRPDFVLNLAEGTGNSRGRESQVPAILETLGIPYSGSDPVALGMTLDKYLANLVLKAVNLPVPLMFTVKDAEEVKRLEGIFGERERFIVKPRWEGSSRGIFLNSLVSNFAELRERTERVFSRYRQPAVVEEFLEKDEITAGICGNGDSARLLGMMRIVPRDKAGKFFLYSLENKREWRTKIRYEPPEAIPEELRTLVEKYALEAFRALELRDFARIDFRVDTNNVPRIIDVNPLPGLSPHYSDLPILYRLRGKSYPELIRTILGAALARCGFEWTGGRGKTREISCPVTSASAACLAGRPVSHHGGTPKRKEAPRRPQWDTPHGVPSGRGLHGHVC